MAIPTLVPLICWFSFITIPHLALSTLAQSDNYIIHMDLSVMPRAFSSQHSWYMAILPSSSHNPQVIPSSSSLSSKLIYSYNHVINGFSATLSPNELEALKATPGYISAIRDSSAKLDTTHSPRFLGLNPNFGAWPTADYGEDVIIGLVDTGIWPESESYKDDGMSEIPSRWKGGCENGTQFSSSLCNKKLIGAKFFNRGLLAKKPNITIIMNSTRDLEGHGTHTSTTAAGSYVDGASYFGYAAGRASGVAPKARVAMYKVFWFEGVYISDIIAAIDSAISDGVDIISLSFGWDVVPLYKDPLAIAAFAAIEKGIFVSMSAGNSGPHLATLHNGIPWVITVAAGTVDREFRGTLKLGNGVSVTGLSLYPGNFSASQYIPVVYMGRCGNRKDLIKVRNKVVVCEDKYQTLFHQLVNLAKAKVVAGVIISNSTEVTYFLQMLEFPSIFLIPKEGELVKDYVKKISAPKARLAFNTTILGSRPAPSVDSYSSRGPSPNCPFVLKPDVLAPGTLILAAWPQKVPTMELDAQNLFSSFNLLTGTSMSCPHVAGMAALLKGAHPNWSPAAIRSAIMTTSDMFDNTGEFIKDIGDNYKRASPLAIGAGHVKPNKALDPGLVYDAAIGDYVNLLCALNFSEKNISIITRSAENDCSNKSLDLNYPSFIAFFNGNDSLSSPKSRTVIKEFHRTVTNVGEGESLYKASVTPIKGFEVSVIPDKLLFKQKKEKQSYKLRIEGPSRMKEKVAFGHLTWVDSKHMVRSPIVLTRLNFQPISSES